MFKIIRVFLGTALGLVIVNNLGFLSISGLLNYLWATLVVMAVVFVFRGLSF